MFGEVIEELKCRTDIRAQLCDSMA
jgi:hypothetical protein